MAEFTFDSTEALDSELKRRTRLEALTVVNNIRSKSMDPPMATRIHWMTENMKAMMLKMTCTDCGQLSYPEDRYICAEGHLYCSVCGKDRGIKHDFKCWAESIDEKVKDEISDIQEEPLHFPLCQKKIIACPPDPVYTAMWCNAVWKCPNEAKGCKDQITGTNFCLHWEDCNQKYAQQEVTKASTQEESESSTVAAEPLGKPCPITGCEMICSDNEIMEHLTTHHLLEVYDVKTVDQGYNGTINIPEIVIEDRVPYNCILRLPNKVFLLCIEPVSFLTPHDYLSAWVRQLNVNNNVDQEEPEPYNFLWENNVNRQGGTQVRFTSECCNWGKPTEDIVDKRECMLLPYSFIKMHLVRKITMDNVQLEEGGQSTKSEDSVDIYTSCN